MHAVNKINIDSYLRFLHNGYSLFLSGFGNRHKKSAHTPSARIAANFHGRKAHPEE